jgi:MFS family permease
MVIVNTVVVVKGSLGGSDSDVALALACFGGGSMIAALVLPRLLDHIADPAVMLAAASALGVVLLGFALFALAVGLGPSRSVIWPVLLATWLLLGIGYSAVMTPSGRLLRRSAQPADRPAVFAAQFALSHACWLVTYPVAGWLGSSAGMVPTLLALAAITLGGLLLAGWLWPREDTGVVPHQHPELPPEHPHVRGEPSRHAHAYVIDDLHPHWP